MFRARREKLLQSQPGGVFIFASNAEVLRNPDVHYPFRQESNFYYLSGFEEPESFLVLAPAKSKPGAHKMVLFVRRRDPEKEMWEGERYGIEGARQVFGADEAYPIDELDSKLPELLQGSDHVYYRMGLSEPVDRQILSALEKHRRSLGRSGKSLPPIADPNELVGEMRLFKTPDELRVIREACRVSALAHKTAMQETRPGMNEFEVEALIDYVFRKNGCQRVGYGSIVAGGANAACLHYRANNAVLNDGELLLIDAGGERDYYTADITRTFPVGRKFTQAQAKAYEIVLDAQKVGLSLSKPGSKLPEIHRRVCESLIDGMLRAGLLKGNAEELFKSNAFKRFYPHNTSHWLGIDVHDVGLYTRDGEARALEPGMVFTVEPGFYVQPGDREAPAEFRNIGIRIEDDVLVTTDGCEVMTQDAPKERADIEALRAAAKF
jgi:Xaa-Pro aminopeptidase